MYAPEDKAAQQIRDSWKQKQVQFILAHSVQKEVDHPNTPADVKREATDMIFSIPTGLISDEVKRKDTSALLRHIQKLNDFLVVTEPANATVSDLVNT